MKDFYMKNEISKYEKRVCFSAGTITGMCIVAVPTILFLIFR